jgi:hypothetical protein
MKKITVLLLGITFLFSSCAFHKGLTTNANVNNTEVVLTKKNFKVTERVQGESKATYILGIGGHSRNAMIAEARTKMLSNANIIGSSKAIINETVETKKSFFPFVGVAKVVVSGYVIEFTE